MGKPIKNKAENIYGDETIGLIAIDLGIRCGLAWFSSKPELVWYRSTNFGKLARLKKAIPGILDEWPQTTHMVIEGGGPLARPWIKEAHYRGIAVLQTTAEEWRNELLLGREQVSGQVAKQVALEKALELIHRLSAKKPPVKMQDDVAEAILCGWWAMKWLSANG